MIRWIGALATCVVLIGCSGGAQTTESGAVKTPPATPVANGTFKVALLTPGPISDAGWSAMAYDGLQAIKSDLGAEVNNQETKDATIESAMRDYAQKGYSLIIGHGFEYNEPGVKLSKEFPKTVFVSSSGGATAANAGAFRFTLEEGFYLAGYLAGKLTKTGKVAVVGLDIPPIRSTFTGFEAGAKAAKPDIKIIEEFLGPSDDIAKAKQATLAAIGQGADFVIHQANQNAQGVFDACKEKTVYAFGANADQNANESGIVIASAVIVARPAFLAIAKQVKDGQYKGQVLRMGMKDKAIDFVLNPKLKSKVPADIQKALDDEKQKILSGDVKVPIAEF